MQHVSAGTVKTLDALRFRRQRGAERKRANRPARYSRERQIHEMSLHILEDNAGRRGLLVYNGAAAAAGHSEPVSAGAGPGSAVLTDII